MLREFLAALLPLRPERVTMYRVYRGDSLQAAWADQGDEMVVGRYIGGLLRAGAGMVVVEAVEMEKEAADRIGADETISVE